MRTPRLEYLSGVLPPIQGRPVYWNVRNSLPNSMKTTSSTPHLLKARGYKMTLTHGISSWSRGTSDDLPLFRSPGLSPSGERASKPFTVNETW